MSATRRADSEEYARAAAAAREIRETSADQLHDLVVERDTMASYTEFVRAVQQIGHIGRQLGESRARQLQAREMGLPLTPSVRQEREALTLLRHSVMSAGAICGLWCAAMDVEEQKRRELEGPARNGRRRKQSDEETI